MILLGLGANLPSPEHGTPRETLEAALDSLGRMGIQVLGRSPWYRSAPLPPSGQPWFVNAVARIGTDLAAADLLDRFHAVEARFGRTRDRRWQARVIDLDLLDYRGLILDGAGGGPILPHPRLHERAFVLLPLRDLVPDWRHPARHLSVDELIAALPAGQMIEREGGERG